MKKLFALLVMLTASLGSWAYNSGNFTGVSFQDKGSDTQFIELTVGGSLDAWKSADTNGTEQGYMADNPNRTKLVITGPMTAEDFSALTGSTWDKFITVDLSKVTVTNPSYIANMNLKNAETIILPNGLTKAQIQGLQGEAKNVVAGITGETVPYEIIHYWFTVPNTSTPVEYTEATEGQTSVTLNDYPLMANLTLVEGYPKYKYTYAASDREYLITETEYTNNITQAWSQNNVLYDFYNPSELEVKLTQDGETVSWYYNGNNFGWDLSNNNGTSFVQYNPETGTYTLTQNAWNSELNNTVNTGETVTRVSTPKYTYSWLENGNTTSKTFTGQKYQYPDNSNFYGKVGYGTNSYQILPTAVYQYTYKDLSGTTQTVEYSSPTSQIKLGTYTGTLNLTTTSEIQTKFVVDGMAAYVNTAGSLSSVATTIYDATVLSQYQAAKNITVIGNINNNDLTEIKYDNFKEATFINMSGATLASTSDIKTMHACPTAAILLPQIATSNGGVRTISLSELGTLQDAQTYGTNVTNTYTSGVQTFIQGYQCLAYYDLNTNGELDVNKLNVYSYSDVVANLAPAVVQEQTAIKFLPMYDATGEFKDYAGNQKTVAFNPFLNALGDLPALSMDLSEINQNMMPHFTEGTYTAKDENNNNTVVTLTTQGLSQYTHYLTVYGNSGNSYNKNFDFTLESGSNFTYPSTVWVVSAFKSNNEYVLDENGNKIEREDKPGSYKRTGHASVAHYAGKFLSASEPTNIVYVRTSDHLAAALNYMTDEAKVAKRQIFVGNLTSTDMSAINATKQEAGAVYDGKIHSEKIDLISAVATNAVLQSLDNDYVKYLALPDDANNAINATSSSLCAFSDACTSLLCVGAYNPTADLYTTWSRENLDSEGKQISSVFYVTDMIKPKDGRISGQNRATGLTKVNMSGYLCSDDIDISADNTSSGLTSAVVSSANFEHAIFAPYKDMNFSAIGGVSWGNLSELTLPTEMTTIPADCLNGMESLTELCIPSNYTKIEDRAFKGTRLNHVWTTSAATDTNMKEGVYDHGTSSITLSSQLTHIGSEAFSTLFTANTGDNDDEVLASTIKDVWVLNETAPYCGKNAFPSTSYMGNNDFAGKDAHPINRNTYITDEPNYLAVLHYPSTIIGTDEEKNYTDVTRNYTLYDETGVTDGQGNPIKWPLVTEFERSYNQAVTGVTWNAWDENRDETPGATYGEVYYGTTPIYYANAAVENMPDPTVLSVQSDANNTYDWKQYMGWHQFVLANGYSYKTTVPPTTTEYEQKGWYTLCIPYDMTAAELVNLIGVPASVNATYTKATNETEIEGIGILPTVYTLKSVTRKNPNIVLHFSKDLMGVIANNQDIVYKDVDVEDYGTDSYDYVPYTYVGKTGENGKNDVNTRIFIKGGYSYLVRPILPAGKSISGTLGKYLLANSSFNTNDLGNKHTVSTGYVAAPIITQKVVARTVAENSALDRTYKPGETINYTDGTEADGKYFYYFVGSYTEETIPQYAYYMNDENATDPKKIYITRTQSAGTTWKPFTSIIGGKCNNDAAKYLTKNTGNDGFSGITTYFVNLLNNDDYFVSHNSVKYNFTFEDEDGLDQALAIDKIDGENVNALETEGVVYNMAGQKVGNSLKGLDKGLYILNGKKVLVK